MSKVLCIMDMQNDFITGALRNEEGIKIILRTPVLSAMRCYSKPHFRKHQLSFMKMLMPEPHRKNTKQLYK